MILNLLKLIGGLVLIIYGADLLTDGASSVARRFRVSGLVIGLTIVAIGTSMPEFVVSLISALDGKPDMSMGNVIGSNVMNILLVLGITSLIHPLKVDKSTAFAEMPYLLTITLVVAAMASDRQLTGATESIIDRIDGIALLAFFVTFLGYSFYIATRDRASANQQEPPTLSSNIKVYSWWVSILMIVGGLVGLILGGSLFTDGASDVARGLGISEAVIGITLVAIGTSAPELATSIVAARKGEVGMAIGNVVGSNIFNATMVLGVTSVFKPIASSGMGAVDLIVFLASAILLFVSTLYYDKRELKKNEGIFFILCYMSYIGWLVWQTMTKGA